MNPNNPQPSREEIEARLTALLLGELPGAEAELLRWTISQDPELAKLHDQLKQTIGLVREVAASPDEAGAESAAALKMAAARREKLLAHFKTITPKEFAPAPAKRRKFGWLVPLAAVLVVAALLAALLLPALSTAKLRARHPLKNASGAYALDELQDQGSLSINESFKRSKSAETAPVAERPTGVITETNSVELGWAAPQPLVPPATPIVLPPPVVVADDWSSTAGMQTFAAASSDLPAANHFGSSYAFVPSNTGGAGGGGGGAGFGGGGIGGNLGNPGPATVWSPGGSGADSSSDVTFATAASPLSHGASYSLRSPVETSPDAGQGGVYSSTAVGYVNLPENAKGGQLLSVPTTGENGQLAANESKDKGVARAGKLDSNSTIVLPQDSTRNAEALNGVVVASDNGSDRRNLGIIAEAGTPAPTLTTASGNLADNTPNSDRSGRSGYTGQPGNREGQAERLFRNRVMASTTSALESREQKVEVMPLSSAAPAETPVPIEIPPPADASAPPEVPANTVPAGLPSGVVVSADTSPASIPASAANPTGAFPGGAPASQSPTLSSPAMPVLGDIPVIGHLSRSPDQRALTQALAPDDTAPQTPPEAAPVPQPEITTKDNAFSTFSLNVSDVSFKLAAASLEHNVYPQSGSIRSEEFINAFDYRDPEPPAGAPVGFAWERAGDPFEHNRDFLRFSIKTAAEGRAPGRPLNLVLLLDKSGSMERADRVAIIHEALRVLATQLGPHDTLSVITFARTPRLYVDGVPGSQAGDVFGKVTGLTPQGGTNLEEAMNLAYQTALRHYLQGGVNRVVLMTDGAANLGDVDAQHFKQKVEANRKQGIALDCFGVGWEDYNDNLLELLASHGDGRYGFLNTPEEASSGFAAQLAGALKVAAADVKVQVEFNPARVTAYRQIGYASHQLTKQQFRDNTVDAAVIGAAESGNALYTIQVNPQGDGPLATVRVRFRVPGTSEVQEHSWLVSYMGSAVALDQASPAMRLAATAGTFAEWLMATPGTEDVTLDQLLNYLKGVPEVYGTDPRPKQLEWMIRQAKNFDGKG